MPLNKMGEFTFNHTGQQDDLYSSMTAAEIKTAFDSRGDELKTSLNNLIDALKAQTAGDSGAQNIGIEPITGVAGTNVQEALEDLRLDINAAVAGTIPDGSIPKEKLAFEIATDAQSVSITDANSHFTATNVEGALEELFTSANSVKTNVSGAIGLPATVNDTGSQLAGYITTEKGRIASNVGDGSNADTLKYLVDRLAARLDELATNVNAKGVAATAADTLAQLVTKVSQIPTGKKSASGTVTSSASMSGFTLGNNTGYSAYVAQVTGLDFIPSVIHLFEVGTGSITYMTVYNKGIMLPDYNTTISMNMVHANTNIAFNPIGFRLDGVQAYSIGTGFRMPVKSASKSYKWYAFE